MIVKAQTERTRQQAEERKRLMPKVLELFKSGMPVKAIGRSLGGRSAFYIQRILMEAGVSRPRKPPHNRKPPTGRYAHLK